MQEIFVHILFLMINIFITLVFSHLGGLYSSLKLLNVPSSLLVYDLLVTKLTKQINQKLHKHIKIKDFSINFIIKIHIKIN